MAGTTKLSTDIQGALSSIFHPLRPGRVPEHHRHPAVSGRQPARSPTADNDWWNMVYHWDDCPVLAGLDLGDYTSDAVQNDSGSSQELLSRLLHRHPGRLDQGTLTTCCPAAKRSGRP